MWWAENAIRCGACIPYRCDLPLDRNSLRQALRTPATNPGATNENRHERVDGRGSRLRETQRVQCRAGTNTHTASRTTARRHPRTPAGKSFPGRMLDILAAARRQGLAWPWLGQRSGSMKNWTTPPTPLLPTPPHLGRQPLWSPSIASGLGCTIARLHGVGKCNRADD